MLTIFGEEYSTEVLKAAWSCLWDYAKSSGNPVLKTDAFSVTVFPADRYGSDVTMYKACIVLRGGKRTYSRPYSPVEDAKEGAFAKLFVRPPAMHAKPFPGDVPAITRWF